MAGLRRYWRTSSAVQVLLIRESDGTPVPDLFSAWITLDNPAKLNAYDTAMLKSLVLALARASHARDVVAVVLTGAGERAFCTGGDAVHYAEAYAGRPQEFARYLRLFSDVITAITASQTNCALTAASITANFA